MIAPCRDLKRGPSRPPYRPRLVGAATAVIVLAASAALPLRAEQEPPSGAPGVAGAKPGALRGLSRNSDQPIDINSDLLTVYDAKKVAVFTGRVKAIQGDTTLTTSELQVYYMGSENPLMGGAASKEAGQAQGQGSATPSGEAPAPAETPAPETRLTKIEAKGDVVVRNAENQSTKGDHMLYDVAAQTVTMTGNVLIRSDKDQTTKGKTAVYDMTKETVTVRGDVVLTSGKDQTAHSDWALYDVPGELVTVGGNVVLTQGQNVLKGSKLVINLATGESKFENPGDAAANNRIRALFMPNETGKRKSAEDDAGGTADSEGPILLRPRTD